MKPCTNTKCSDYYSRAIDGSNCRIYRNSQLHLCDKYTSDQTISTEQQVAASRFEITAGEIGVLVAEKNKAYGDSFSKCDDFLKLLYPSGIQPDQYGDALAMVRIFDKQMRIATRKDAFGESPYRDIAGYGILGAVKDDGAK